MGDIDLFDAHTHIGFNDPDGVTGPPEELLDALRHAGARSAVFPMHEPGGYPAANDWVIDVARESGGALTPYCRLDPAAEPLAEAQRAVAAGAKGIKLHPRAEGFTLDHPELGPVFEWAQARRLPVLVHAGRGIPALGRHAVELCERHPELRLILAHAGICDLAWIWREAERLPNLFFDTSWWTASDLLALLSLVPPRNVLFASDAPYGFVAHAGALHLRYALQVGHRPEALRSIFGGQAARIVAGEDVVDLGPAIGPAGIDHDPLLARVETFLISAVGQLLAGADASEALSLAVLACEVGEGVPQSDAAAAVLRVLEARDEWLAAGPHPDRGFRIEAGFHYLMAAICLARTPGVPMPPVGEPAVRPGEREG